MKNTLKTTGPLRSLPFRVAALVAVLLPLTTGSVARADDDDGDNFFQNVPAAVQVPAGNVLTFAAHGRGVQIYTWSTANSSWGTSTPSAVLFEDDAGVVGIHFAGPTWQHNDGSKVVAHKVAAVTVNPEAIPWLLLQATSTSGPGRFADVTYVQRLRTRGGLAPASPGTFDGQQVLVPYSAAYLFYKAQ